MRNFRTIFEIITAILLAFVLYVFGYQPIQSDASSNASRNTNIISEESSGTGGNRGTDGYLTITMLDVLHGDAILLQDGKQNIMIDVGHNSNQGLVERKLDERGITKINTVFVTHHHSDHMGNIFKIAGKYKVGRILDNALVNERNAVSVKLNDILRKGNYKNKVLRDGEVVKFGRDLWFEVLAPGNFYDTGLHQNINNTSIVMKMHYKDFTMMFTGDVENPVEVAIANKYGNLLKSDVLKVAHHGSRTSSNYQFISKVRPQFAVISCGDFNKYHHPNKNVVGALNHLGATVYNTNANGDIVIKTDGKNFTVQCDR